MILIRAVARTGEPGDFLSGKQRTILPISRQPNVMKLEYNTSIDVAFGQNFEKFPTRVVFPKKRKK